MSRKLYSKNGVHHNYIFQNADKTWCLTKKKCQFNNSLDDGAYNCDIFFFTIWLEGCVYVTKYVTVFYLLQDFLYGIFFYELNYKWSLAIILIFLMQYIFWHSLSLMKHITINNPYHIYHIWFKICIKWL